MSLWATRRKAVYTLVFGFILVVFVGIPTFFFLYEKPTCSDGKKNGDETGLDCGGSCVRLCAADFSAPRSLWERFIEVTPGIYNLLAYVENPNLSVGAKDVSYVFRLYDRGGLLITERKGATNISVGKKFAIFESSISTGERVPARVTFEFDPDFEWQAIAPDAVLGVSSINTDSPDGTSRIEALLKNTSRDRVGRTEVVAIVYDSLGNAMTFSRTIVDELLANTEYPVVFTWPTTFPDFVSRTEIISRPDNR